MPLKSSTLVVPPRSPLIELPPAPLLPQPTPPSFTTAPAGNLVPPVSALTPVPAGADTTAASANRSRRKRNPLLGKGERFTVCLRSGGELTTREARAKAQGGPSSSRNSAPSSRKARAAAEGLMSHASLLAPTPVPVPVALPSVLHRDIDPQASVVPPLIAPVNEQLQQQALSSATAHVLSTASTRSANFEFPQTMAIDLPHEYVGQGRNKSREDDPIASEESAVRLARQEPRSIRPLPVKASGLGPVPVARTKAPTRQPAVSAAVAAGSRPSALPPPKARASSASHPPSKASIPVAPTAGKGPLRKMVSLPMRVAAPAPLPKPDLNATKALPPPLPPRPIPKAVASLQSSTAQVPSPAPSADTLPGRREDWEDSGVMEVDEVDDSGDTPEWFNAPLPTAATGNAIVEAPQPQQASIQPLVTTRANNSAPLTPAALVWRPELERRASSSSLVSRLSSGFNFIASAFSPSAPAAPVEPPVEKDVMPMVEIRHAPVSHRPETPATFVTASEMVSSAASVMDVDAAPPAPATLSSRAQPAAVERKRTSKATTERRDGALRPSNRQPTATRSGDGKVKTVDRRRGTTGLSSATTAGSAQPRSAPIPRTRPAPHPAPTARPVPTDRAPSMARSAPPARPAQPPRPTSAHVSRPRVPPAPELPFYGPPALPQAKFEAYRDSLASRSPARPSLRDVERAIDIEARRRYWEEVWRSDTEGQHTEGQPEGGTPARFPLSLDPGAVASPDPRAEAWRNRAGHESRQRAAQRQVFDSRRKELEQLKKAEAEREKAALARITADVVKELRNAPRGGARRLK